MRNSHFLSIVFLLLPTMLCSQACGWMGMANSSHFQVEGISVVHGKKMYVFYGFIGGTQITNTVERFDPYAGPLGQWTSLASMITGVTHTDATVIEDEIWLVGGFVGNHGGPSIPDVQIYDIATNTWSLGTPLPEPHASGGTVYLGRKVYVFSGLKPDRSTGENHHFVFDMDNPTAGWDTLAPHPHPRNHMGSVALMGKIYTIGGETGHDGAPVIDFDYMEVYDPNTDTWSTSTSLPEVRSHIEPGTFAQDGLIYVTGGNTTCCPSLLTSILTFDPELNTWSTVCDMPTFLTAPAAKMVDSIFILAHGGQYGYTNPQNKTYTFNVQQNKKYELGFWPKNLDFTLEVGATTEGEANLYAISEEVPFEIDLTNLPSWITLVTRDSGFVATHTGEEINVHLDASGLVYGQYTHTLFAREDMQQPQSGYAMDSLLITLSVDAPLATPETETDLSSKTNGFFIYPNPVRDVIHVDLSLPGEISCTIRVLDVQGKVVFERVFADGNHEIHTQINCENWTPGCYLVESTSLEKRQVKKILLK